jgi:hypothetical protein
VKLPFSWPNRVDSISSFGIEPQSSTTNGLVLRFEVLWIARATISLPVPVSPVIRQVRSLGATFSSCAKICRIAAEPPMIASKRSRFDSSISTTSDIGWNWIEVWPRRNTVPGRRKTSRIRSSPTKTPLRELRSRRR